MRPREAKLYALPFLLAPAFVVASQTAGCVNDLAFDDLPPGADASVVDAPIDASVIDANESGVNDGFSGSDTGPGGACSVDALFLGAEDGCTRTALCQRSFFLPDGGTCFGPSCPGRCFEALPCPADGVCPVGAVGALCNDGLFPQKARVCVAGACRTGAECPATHQCVGVGAVMSAGFCSSGTVGQPCTRGPECKSGTCTLFGPLGVCG
ncbi:MAG: hypothetical protein U0183_07630 [Polyangiaceae bacterium]